MQVTVLLSHTMTFEQSGQEIIAVFLGFGPPDYSKKFTLDYSYNKNSGCRSLQLQLHVDERSNRAEEHTV